jgi:cryptochrome
MDVRIWCLQGGESEGLKRLEHYMAKKSWVCKFEKPKGNPASFDPEPATTVLSPYLKFGCVSPRLFYQRLLEVYAKDSSHTKPPVSLEGQLLWREFYYAVGYDTPNFDKVCCGVKHN